MPKSEIPSDENIFDNAPKNEEANSNISHHTSSSLASTPSDGSPYTAIESSEHVANSKEWKKQMNPWLAGGIGVVTGIIATSLVLNGSNFGTDSASKEAIQQMEDALVLCDDPSGIYISDGGRSLLFDTKGEEERSGASISDLVCILAALEMPAHVADKMERTTALAGNQAATWNNFEAEWSYHPDRGMDGVVIVVDSK